MASGTVQTGLIEKVQINNGTEHRIASTAYGICSTDADKANKIVQIDGFELVPGVTIHIKFTHDNTALTPPTLNVNGTGAINIVQYDDVAAGIVSETSGWQIGAVISLTYDGTYWVRDSGYNTNTTYATLTQELINTGTETTGKLITAKILKDTIADAFQNVDLSNLDVASSSHTHGNIQNNGALQTNDITIGDGDKLVVTDESDNNKIARTSIEFDTSATSEVLSKAGTWVPMYVHPTTNGNKHIPADGESGQFLGWSADGTAAWVTITAANLGLSNAMHFIGIVASNSEHTPSDGSNQTPSINGLSSYTPVAGDVVIDKDYSREYVYTTANAWELLGQDASTTYNSDTITALSDFQVNRTNTWISKIEQLSDRTISVERAQLDTSGQWSGNAATATALRYSRTIHIDLTSSNSASFDGTANITPGVDGILPLSHGGTNTSTPPIVGGIIYGDSTLNNGVLYASTGAGSAGQVLISQGTDAPIWYEGLLLTSTPIDSTTTYNASFNGTVSIASNTAIGGTLTVTGVTTLSSNLTITGNIIPSATNTYTLGSDTYRWQKVYIGTDDTYGSAIIPIYWNDGVPTASTATVGSETQSLWLDEGTLTAIEYTANRLYYSASTISFAATNHYATDTTLAINDASTQYTDLVTRPSDALYVNGSARINNILTVNNGITNDNGILNLIQTIDNNNVISWNYILNTTSFYPTGSNATLGLSTNRWSKLYIGTKDSYGDIYTPIYWNNGVPAEVTPVQRINFTFDTTKPSSLPFVHSAITLDTNVIEIVVESGISYLNSPINWAIIEDTNNDNTPTLILSAATNLSSDQTITGYIKIAHTANLTFSSNT